MWNTPDILHSIKKVLKQDAVTASLPCNSPKKCTVTYLNNCFILDNAIWMPQRRAVSFESFFVHKGATCVRSDLFVWNVVVLKSVRNNWNWNNCWNIHLRFGAKQIIQWFLMILSCLIIFFFDFRTTNIWMLLVQWTSRIKKSFCPAWTMCLSLSRITFVFTA